MTKEIKISKKDVVACNYWKACDYYKQLKRLEQENKELKKKLELDEVQLESYFIGEEKICKENEKYRKALEEIDKIAEPRFVNGLNEEADLCNLAMDRIQTKINEVLNA